MKDQLSVEIEDEKSHLKAEGSYEAAGLNKRQNLGGIHTSVWEITWMMISYITLGVWEEEEVIHGKASEGGSFWGQTTSV